MKHSFGKAIVGLLGAVIVAASGWAPIAEARPGVHGGGGGGGGGAVANRPADARANNVRSTSVNNVNNTNRNVNSNRNVNVNQNVNVNRNVNVETHGGCCGGGWDNDYHPVATAAAVTATVAVTAAVVGSVVHSVPPSCVPVNYGGMVYQQCGSTWYQPQGPQYVVVNPPY